MGEERNRGGIYQRRTRGMLSVFSPQALLYFFWTGCFSVCYSFYMSRNVSVTLLCRGRGGITARLMFKASWLENCVRQDCDISHSE